MEEMHTCESCKYFVQHFAKHGRSLTAVSCGNCNNPKLTLTQKRKRQRNNKCEHWEVKESEMKEQSFEKALVEIAEQLSAIATLLKKDQP